MTSNQYDIIVVGGGHAGCEAAMAAANLHSSVLLITMNLNTIGQMSCNPAMGGVAKGQIVREIDAMGGYSGLVTDHATIQFRMLNRSKGPAMWSPRAQTDRTMFALRWRYLLENNKNIDFWQDSVTELLVKKDEVCGVKTSMDISFYSKAVILTNGTFLNGLIHVGSKKFSGGRISEKSSLNLTEQLNKLGFESGRMKTGTPPRVDGRSLDYSCMEMQKGDVNPKFFSYLSSKKNSKQECCYIAYTNSNVHNALKKGFKDSPMFNGQIIGSGPRYCPSIEDKISRFADKTRHLLFIEPEGWNTVEIYVNGFSTSLPYEIQYEALKKIKGFEKVKLFRPGYAIEYDYFSPHQLHLSLETKQIKNLFFAGQINGTTGYEEAAAQGLMAGINAHQKISNDNPLILKRNEAYIGVLIDDLINKGTKEPYRMFTSRAEFRLILRQDNADFRLTEKSHKIGLASKQRYDSVKKRKKAIQKILDYLNKIELKPLEGSNYLKTVNSAPIKDKSSLAQLLKRPEIKIEHFKTISSEIEKHITTYDEEDLLQAEILTKYKTYIEREKINAQKFDNLDRMKIKDSFNYIPIPSLSTEGREKLMKVKPQNVGQASRISGVSPADISILMVYLNKND